jgi:hypothetical protein
MNRIHCRRHYSIDHHLYPSHKLYYTHFITVHFKRRLEGFCFLFSSFQRTVEFCRGAKSDDNRTKDEKNSVRERRTLC